MSVFWDVEDVVLRLEDIVRGYDFNIFYRMFLPTGEDFFAGHCKYENGELISLDGDTYSLKDRILKYKIDDNNLIVWVDKSWGTE